MVHTRSSDFAHDVPKSSDARARAASTGPRGAAPTRPRGAAPTSPPPPPPPVSIEQLVVTQNKLMRVLTKNLMHRGVCQPHHQPEVDSSYTDFLVTYPPTFIKATDPLEADNWLHITKSKFGLLHCTEFQKTLDAAQQLRGSASAWWANYTTTLRDDHQVL
jgi:hypothetical protein